MPKFSLALATFGRTEELDRLMTSLVAQQWRNFELLILDQNADGRVLPHAAKAVAGDLTVHHIRLTPPSLSGARNRGIAEANGEFIAFPDDDCWYEPDTLAAAAAALDTDPTLDGLVINWVEQTFNCTGPAEDDFLEERAWRKFRGGAASSISLILRRDLLVRLNGFDERLGVGQWFGAGEETDLILRALAHGARIRRCHTARVHHRFGPLQSRALHADARELLKRARGTGGLYAKHDLSASTILRGLIAPLLVAIFRGEGLRAWILALVQSIGRLQGMMRWPYSP